MLIRDTIIISDLDGTIVPISGIVSKRNKEAIGKFQSLGGTFTIATGRSPFRACEFAGELGVKGAFIAGNGAVIFDNIKNEDVCNICFEKESYEIIKRLMNAFPEVGVVLIDTDDCYYIINDNESLREMATDGRFKETVYCSLEELPSNCRSGWLALDKADFVEVAVWAAHNKSEFLTFAHSGEYFLDLIPGGISKGTMLEELVGYYGKELENTVAIGDYHNDLEMIKKAALGVAVLNAHEDIKAQADLIVKSCEDDAIADLIEYLIKNES